jgi:hypothetical protein
MYGRNNPGDCLFPLIMGLVYSGVAFFIIVTKETTWQTIGVCLLAFIVGAAHIYYGIRLLRNK